MFHGAPKPALNPPSGAESAAFARAGKARLGAHIPRFGAHGRFARGKRSPAFPKQGRVDGRGGIVVEGRATAVRSGRYPRAFEARGDPEMQSEAPHEAA